MEQECFELNGHRLSEMDLQNLRKRPVGKLPRHRPGEGFLRGPIPWPWLQAAMRLQGKALQIALLLWKQAGCQKKGTVRFCLSHAGEVGIARTTARRALRKLADAGLVEIDRPAGNCLQVTILETPRPMRE